MSFSSEESFTGIRVLKVVCLLCCERHPKHKERSLATCLHPLERWKSARSTKQNKNLNKKVYSCGILVACVASVSVLFRRKERPRNEILGFGRARNETRAKKWNRGEGEGKEAASIFFVYLWQLLTGSNVGTRTQAWQAVWAVFKIPGFVCKRFLPFFATPSPLTRAIFRAVFAPKQHGNACYAG